MGEWDPDAGAVAVHVARVPVACSIGWPRRSGTAKPKVEVAELDLRAGPGRELVAAFAGGAAAVAVRVDEGRDPRRAGRLRRRRAGLLRRSRRRWARWPTRWPTRRSPKWTHDAKALGRGATALGRRSGRCDLRHVARRATCSTPAPPSTPSTSLDRAVSGHRRARGDRGGRRRPVVRRRPVAAHGGRGGRGRRCSPP